MGIRFDEVTAVNAVRSYNAGVYRGRRNIEVGQIAFDRFRDGLPVDNAALVDAIRFVGEDYGGAQRRFLPRGYAEEAALIVSHLGPVTERWNNAAIAAAPILECAPPESLLAYLLTPFHGTKRWPVWASKTLHFIRPAAFPVLDSRAKRALGMPNLGSSAVDYHRYSVACRDALLENATSLNAARDADSGTSPSDLKLLDKILYEIGGRANGLDRN